MSFIYALGDSRWNDISKTFNGIMMDFTNGLGGAPVGSAASNFINLKNNGTTVFSVNKDGVIVGSGLPVNIKTFGAKGDGVTPDNAAFVAAIGTGHKVIYCPAGTYIFNASAQVTLASGISFVGDGIGNTIFKMSAIPANGTDPFYGTGLTDVSFNGITFDGNGLLTQTGHFPNISPFVYIVSSSRVTFEKCEGLGFDTCSILLNIVDHWKALYNRFSRTTFNNTHENHGFLVSASVGAESNNGLALGNYSKNSNLAFNVSYSSIINNEVLGWGDSAGINFPLAACCHDNYVAGNICHDPNPAADKDSYFMGGIENWGPNSVLIGNICYNNNGSGIDNGGHSCNIADNMCYNNGIAANHGTGIYLLYQDATFFAYDCMVIGNHMYDTRAGGSRLQDKGLKFQSSLITGVTIGPNSSYNNITLDYDPNSAVLNAPFWDSTNQKLGIGTSAPNTQLHISRNVAGEVTQFRVQNVYNAAVAYAEMALTTNQGNFLVTVGNTFDATAYFIWDGGLLIFSASAVAGAIRFRTAGNDRIIVDNGGVVEITGSLRIDQAPAAVGTGVKTIQNAADSSTNFGHYAMINMNGTPYYFPCSSVSPT